MKSKYLVCYDICDPAKLGRVFRVVKSIGIHMQYSVFLCSFTWPELQEFKGRIAKIINTNEDDIRIYPLPAGEKIIAIGQGSRVPSGVEILVE